MFIRLTFAMFVYCFIYEKIKIMLLKVNPIHRVFHQPGRGMRMSNAQKNFLVIDLPRQLSFWKFQNGMNAQESRNVISLF